MELGLSLGLGFTAAVNERLGRQEDGQEPEKSHRSNDSDEDDDVDVEDYDHATSSEEEPHRSADQRLAIFVPPVPLDLLPPAPVQNKNVAAARAAPSPAAEEVSSPNSVASSFRAIDFSIFKRNRNGAAVDDGRASDAAANGGASEPASRVSDEDENGVNARKKLRLSKEQSAYLEESFKEHHTLNPKQKHALAKQLNLRPRQVEVWFQNRRARTKLKQTEVDCEYLKRCCETLREENRRLHKELQELRALKSSNPFYMHLPATTLTMCPSCEKVASTSTAAAAAPAAAAAAAAAAAVSAPTTPTTAAAPDSIPKPIPFLAKPRFFPFTAAHNPGHPHQSAAS